MSSFRVFLMTFLVALVCYTAMTISNHGWNLFPIFFGDMMKMNWAGQFNFDLTGFLILSGLWTMWRNNFSASAIGLGIVAFLGGMMFLLKRRRGVPDRTPLLQAPTTRELPKERSQETALPQEEPTPIALKPEQPRPALPEPVDGQEKVGHLITSYPDRAVEVLRLWIHEKDKR